MAKCIETPYGRKTPELLCKSMDALMLQPRLIEMIKRLEDHLDYCGWGDTWERECSQKLQNDLASFNKELTEKGLK